MQIKEIQTKEEISETLPLLAPAYKHLDSKTYVDDVYGMIQNNYKMAAVFEDKKSDKGKCVGVVGIRITHKLQHGKAIEIEDFMVNRNRRTVGVNKMLMRWVDWKATTLRCKNIIGNMETKRADSQRVLSQEQFILDGFSFKKSV